MSSRTNPNKIKQEIQKDITAKIKCNDLEKGRSNAGLKSLYEEEYVSLEKKIMK